MLFRGPFLRLVVGPTYEMRIVGDHLEGVGTKPWGRRLARYQGTNQGIQEYHK